MIAIKWIGCMHACIGMKGMHYCSKRLGMLLVCMPPWMLAMRIVSVIYHPPSSSVFIKGWYFNFLLWVDEVTLEGNWVDQMVCSLIGHVLSILKFEDLFDLGICALRC